MSGLRGVAPKQSEPVDRARPGSKHHFVTELESLLEAIPPVRGRRGRPRQRPDELYGDRAYDRDLTMITSSS